MKLRQRPKYYSLQVDNAPRRFLVDLRFARRLTLLTWKYVPKLQRARAVVHKNDQREMLHRYVARLAGKKWVEVYFANNDPFDCRLGNLQPYRRDEEGARRRTFKNKSVRLRGVYLKKSTGKFGASIRVHGKLLHLGYHATPELAAEAYRVAFKEARPNSRQPV